MEIQTNQIPIWSNTYVYLLPFNCGNFFKIGISSNPNRLTILDKVYSVLKERAVILKGRNRDLGLIENQLLSIKKERNLEFEGLDGWTEIRSMKTWDEVIRISDKLLSEYTLKKIDYFNLIASHKTIPNPHKVDFPQNNLSETIPIRKLMPSGFLQELSTLTGSGKANISTVVTDEKLTAKIWPAVEELARQTNASAYKARIAYLKYRKATKQK